VLIAGMHLLIQGRIHQSQVVERSALEMVERRASRLHNRLDRWLRRTGVGRMLATRLAAAGIEARLVDAAAAAAAIAAAGFVLADTILPRWLAVVAAAGSVRGAWAWLESKRSRRRLAFVAQLPEVARILSNASSAGLSVRTAIEMAAEELDEPAASEMAIVAEQLLLGEALEDALADLERRMPARDVGVLISTLVIQQRSGGDLVRALQDMAMTLEARRDLNRELRTVMSGSVFTGYLVGAMGVGAVLLLNLMNPGVIEELTSSNIGRVVLLVSGILYAVGYSMVKRVTRIDL
jgi:tight adherence protein B